VSDPIYLEGADGHLTRVDRTAYTREKDIQNLIDQHPELLPGDQIDEADPPRWLVIRSEAGIPSEEGGGYWWSVDHLLVDQKGIPTFVEVKRSSDTRVRREVVAQMLEYAANGTAYWRAETLRTWFEDAEKQAGREPEKRLSDFLEGSELDTGTFWDRVASNLQASRVRCVFVADDIPPTLRRLVEFMNEHLDTIQVFAVEVPQYVAKEAGGLRAIVPRLVGQTAKAVATKSVGLQQPGQWDEKTFMADVERRNGAEVRLVCEQLLGWAREHTGRIDWGRGATDGSMIVVKGPPRHGVALFSAWTYGRLEVPFQYLASHPAFADAAAREELRNRLNDVPGIEIPAGGDAINKRPSVALSLLTKPETLLGLLQTFDWVVARMDARSAAEDASNG